MKFHVQICLEWPKGTTWQQHMFHSPIQTLYFIVLTSSKNGVWTSDEVNMPLYIPDLTTAVMAENGSKIVETECIMKCHSLQELSLIGINLQRMSIRLTVSTLSSLPLLFYHLIVQRTCFVNLPAILESCCWRVGSFRDWWVDWWMWGYSCLKGHTFFIKLLFSTK